MEKSIADIESISEELISKLTDASTKHKAETIDPLLKSLKEQRKKAHLLSLKIENLLN